MSLDSKNKLRVIAKETCRKLRQNQTQSEIIIWDVLRNRKLCDKKFNRQFPVFYDLLGKESFYICDFYYHELKLVIEIDGQIPPIRKIKRC
jgi:very-short-patch-repair endonuclease